MATRLYVGNLPFDVTENDLQDLFSKSGAVTTVQLIQDKVTGKSRGFAFVEMADQAGADAAVKSLNDQDFNGRKLVVNEARAREERPRGNFGGGGGGGGRGGGRGGGGGGGGGWRERR